MTDLLSRRDFVRTAALAAAATTLANTAGEARAAAPGKAPLAQGVVYDDTDGTGRFTASKKGIANVLISNGRDVVRTDSNGRYSIALPDNSTLFLVKPRDWMTPVNDAKLPQFYYHHFPAGTPQWRPDPATAPKEAFDPQWYYPGIPASGPLPREINFPLIRRPEKDKFRVLLFGDPQPGNDEQLDWMGRTVIQELISVQDVAFGVTLGDVVNVSRLQYFGPVNRLVSQIGVPWYNVSGNHDQNLIVQDDSQSCDTFKSVYGPTTYAFEYAQASFVVLKSIIRNPFAGFEHPDDSNGGYRPKGDDYHDGFQPDQIEFLKNYLATVPKDRPVVLLLHAPIGIADAKDTRDDEAKAGGSNGEREIFQLLSGRPNTLSISGHTHVQAHYFIGRDKGFDGPGEHHHFNSICVRGAGYRGPLDETQTPSCMASDGCAQGYTFLGFDGNQYDLTYKAARRQPDHQMNLFMPAVVPAGDATVNVTANVFAGSPKSKVELRIAKRPPVAMQNVLMPDPAMLETLKGQKTDLPWTGPKYKEKKPKKSRHIWQAALPANLPVGTHVAEVRTTDLFGKTYVARRVFRVVDGKDTATAMTNSAK